MKIIFILLALAAIYYLNRKPAKGRRGATSFLQDLIGREANSSDLFEREQDVPPPVMHEEFTKEARRSSPPKERIDRNPVNRFKKPAFNETQSRETKTVKQAMQVEKLEPSLSSFDLRKAVIYTEILHPKYKEI